MVIPSLLAACAGPADLTNSIRGIQIVAIEPIPASPTPLERLTLKTWVADGLGRGADVLIWVCTPLDGMCLEALPPNSTGLPLSTWTRVGRADVMFESTNPWPFFVGLVGDNVQLPSAFLGGNLLVWGLACAPGVCPIIDQVAIDPASGSEAWYEAAIALANPEEWIDDLPRGQVSLAVKAVAVTLDDPTDTTTVTDPYRGPLEDPTSTGPNRAPVVKLLEDQVRVSRFGLSDPDADPLLIRSFATAGGVVQRWAGDSAVTVMWEEPLLVDREPVRFVVAEDGRGGTGVWCSDPATDPCATPDLTIGSEDQPIRPGDAMPLEMVTSQRYEFRIPIALQSTAREHVVAAEVIIDGDPVATYTDTLIPLVGLTDGACAVQDHELRVVLDRSFSPVERCRVLGNVATVRVSASGASGDAESEVEVVLTGTADLGCQSL